jgi:DNA (cytosine-5)-methyltransferase 1
MFIRGGEMGLQHELDMAFNYEPILYEEIECGSHEIKEGKKANLAKMAKQGDINLLRASREFDGKNNLFSERVQWKNDVVRTITASGSDIWIENSGYRINDLEIISASTFPQDYNFCKEKVKYICGMSVPPIMIKRIVTRLIESGVFG